MDSLMPLPLGRVTAESCLPRVKRFVRRVAKTDPEASFTVAMSKDPGYLSKLVTTPTRPVLRPFVTMMVFPTSNLIISTTYIKGDVGGGMCGCVRGLTRYYPRLFLPVAAIELTLPVARSSFTVSSFLMMGSGYLMVRPSWDTT